ncbi:hypothetical protein BKA58DRAFT_393230 [Alternaria rosae]|uniref:uncharacterized protein n=1 Tax=Alternaria rosae TaxID=1187941 RepID=UPI001E8CCE14|nr:uncharacterized protein BKA58DRAFT_393230 [Alternaria rosae]KAH6858899.1 hypothetical protein BKA58DRAFT_393230 [Alternaria rosae]
MLYSRFASSCVLVKGRGFNSHSVQSLLFCTFLFTTRTGVTMYTIVMGKGTVHLCYLILSFFMYLLYSLLSHTQNILLDPLHTLFVSTFCLLHHSVFFNLVSALIYNS